MTIQIRNLVPAALLATVMFTTTAVHAEGYMGKVCLLSTVTARETGPVTESPVVVTYDTNFLGGGAYALSGSVNIPGQPYIFTGYGNQIGNILYMNITSTQLHPDPDNWHDAAVQQAKLNLATMTGTFYEIGHNFNPKLSGTQQWNESYTAGTITKTPCP